jgi:hypothetical protein
MLKCSMANRKPGRASKLRCRRVLNGGSCTCSTESLTNDVDNAGELDCGETTMHLGCVESHVSGGETDARLDHARDVWSERPSQ